MLDELRKAEARFIELEEKLGDSDIIATDPKYRDYLIEHGRLCGIVEAFRSFKRAKAQLEEAEELALDKSDPEFAEMAAAEIPSLRGQSHESLENLKGLILANEDDGNRNAIVEIRAGTGGDEAALFVADLVRMYSSFADDKGWKVEYLGSSVSEKGGFKEITMSISGEMVYSIMRYESGTHRVQRVPETESQGRIHTSASTVAVLPEAEDIEVDIKAEDIRKDTYCASGPGGQHVNTTYSAIRITHLPTGLVVTCQDEKSQHKNFDKAMRVLRSRLYDLMKSESDKLRSDDRKSQVGSGDRSQRIRTYNYPQNRITDHRIGLTLYDLAGVINGNMGPVVDALQDEAKRKRFGELF